MSAFERITDSSPTSRHVCFVPDSEVPDVENDANRFLSHRQTEMSA
jgi:hypothetical protein